MFSRSGHRRCDLVDLIHQVAGFFSGRTFGLFGWFCNGHLLIAFSLGSFHSLSALAVVFDPLIGNVVHNNRCRLHIRFLFLVIPVISGTVLDGADKTGDGDLHGPQKRQNNRKTQNDIGNGVTAGPVEQFAQKTAKQTAGEAVHAAVEQFNK